jgi:hypothetical protein
MAIRVERYAGYRGEQEPIINNRIQSLQIALWILALLAVCYAAYFIIKRRR